MKNIICVICPKGCHLSVDEQHDFHVTGNGCPRGAVYGKQELLDPRRTLTSTIKIHHGVQERVSVKTSIPIPKAKIWEVMQCLHSLDVIAPVHRGDIVEKNICQTSADLVITKDIEVNTEDRKSKK